MSTMHATEDTINDERVMEYLGSLIDDSELYGAAAEGLRRAIDAEVLDTLLIQQDTSSKHTSLKGKSKC